MQPIPRSLLTSALVAVLVIPFCSRAAAPQATQHFDGTKLASTVTIYRDAWGTPHVFGETDASTIFGFAYAQAEDNFRQMEENFVLALGRGAELYGDPLVNEDRLNRALRIEEHARADYDAMAPAMRRLCDAFAAGVMYYLERHPAVHPRLLTTIAPWYPLAFVRYNYYQNGFVRDPKLGKLQFETAMLAAPQDRENGSNGWVIAPTRSATGHAMLFIDPHLPLFGSGQVYEAHIHSDEGSGWEFTGYARFGFPVPYIGHNDALGWMSTDNAADEVDGYVEHFDDPGRPLAYRYGRGYRVAREYVDTIRVKTDRGVEVRTYTSRWTHHGPVVAIAGGLPVAVRLPKYESHGWVPQWYRMTRAHTLRELKAAIAPLDMLFGNVMSADRNGDIFYVYNAAVPRRDPHFDWSGPVDGSDPRTEWHGDYALNELPQLTNPASGWMENCNTSPFALTTDGNPDPARYPKFMVREGVGPGADLNNPRGRASFRILEGTTRWTFEAWTRAAFDTRVITADEVLSDWISRVQSTSGANTVVDSALQVLGAWDHRSSVSSTAMTLFANWHRRMARLEPSAANLTRTVGDAITDLRQRFGVWQVPYGEVNRIQRSTLPPARGVGLPTFDDDRPSTGLPAANGNDGAIFTIYSVPGRQDKRQYGVLGDTYVSVVEFGPHASARSVMPFGESGDSANAHYTDQAALYARGELKPSWFTREEVRQHAVRTYKPGE